VFMNSHAKVFYSIFFKRKEKRVQKINGLSTKLLNS